MKRGVFSLIGVQIIVAFFAVSTLYAEEPAEEDTLDARYKRANSLAGQGKYEKALKLYTEVAKEAPDSFPNAFYNGGEVARAMGACPRAIVFFEGYKQLDKTVSKNVENKIGPCRKKSGMAQLQFSVSPNRPVSLYLNGILFRKNKRLSQAEIPAGSWEVEVVAADFNADRTKVDLEPGDELSIRFELERKTFYGKVKLKVDEEKARVRLEPRDLDKPASQTEAVRSETPVEKSIRLPTGQYFLEVKKEGYHRWIRNIQIDRNNTTRVRVDMQRKLAGVPGEE